MASLSQYCVLSILCCWLSITNADDSTNLLSSTLSISNTYDYLCLNRTAFMRLFLVCDASAKRVYIIPTLCTTTYHLSNMTHSNEMLLFGKCPFANLVHTGNEESGLLLPATIPDVTRFNDDVMCKSTHRTGTLCTYCNNATAVSLNSILMTCLPIQRCHSYYWMYFILSHIVPVTLTFLVVVIFDINLNSGYAYSYIFFAQLLSLQEVKRLRTTGLLYVTKSSVSYKLSIPFMMFYSIWDLSVGDLLLPDGCVSRGIDIYDVIALGYIPTYYSFFLCLVMHFVILLYRKKCFVIVRLIDCITICFRKLEVGRRNKQLSLVKTFATFFLLSYSNLLSTSIMLLSPIHLYDKEGTRISSVYLYDGSTRYFTGGKQIVLSVFAIFTICVILVLPTLILLLYPIKPFRTLLRYMKLNRYCPVTLMNMFQGCYKDGSNGTRDCRWFSAVYFILRFIILLPLILLRNLLYDVSITLILILQVVLLLIIILITTVNPYKVVWHNKLDIAMMSLTVFILSLICIDYLYETIANPHIIEIILIITLAIPFICAVLFIGYHIIVRMLLCTRLSVKAWRSVRGVPSATTPLSPSDNCHALGDELTPSLPDRVLHPTIYSEHSKRAVADDLVSLQYGTVK